MTPQKHILKSKIYVCHPVPEQSPEICLCANVFPFPDKSFPERIFLDASRALAAREFGLWMPVRQCLLFPGQPKFLTPGVDPNDARISMGHLCQKLTVWADFFFLTC